MMKRPTKRPGWMQIFCALSFTATGALVFNPAQSPSFAADYGKLAAASVARSGAQFLPLGIGKSIVIDLPREIKDVLVADPKIANAVVRSAQRAYIIGAAVGQTNIFFFDAEGQPIASYDIAVTRDLNGVRAALRQALPGAEVNIEGVGDGVMLTGSVTNPIEAQQAGDLAARLVGGADKVVNSIAVRGRDQVMLKVTVAEVQRDVIKQLGVDLNGSLNYGTSVVDFNNVTPFPMVGKRLVDDNAITANFRGVGATLRAMERAGVVRTLAEPNLTAISGESANFLAGGEFPVPKGLACDKTTQMCSMQVEYKKFGITLSFTPVVLSAGRISLRVATEVSELSPDNSLQLAQSPTANSTTTLTIPSVKTRRVDTTLEVPSGGSLAMAGLIQEQTKQAISGMPGLLQVPILGSLFKSRDYTNRQSELMVLVTPYIVRAVKQKDLSRPDDGFSDAADGSTAILSSLNRIYGVPGKADAAQNRRGTYGFITD